CNLGIGQRTELLTSFQGAVVIGLYSRQLAADFSLQHYVLAQTVLNICANQPAPGRCKASGIDLGITVIKRISAQVIFNLQFSIGPIMTVRAEPSCRLVVLSGLAVGSKYTSCNLIFAIS